MLIWLFIGITGAAVAALLYWLLVTTEGVFLGRRVVVWLYDVTAHRYDQIKEFDEEWEHFFIVRPLLRQLSHKPAPLILDVATGTGRAPLFLLNEPTFNGRVIGLDASARMLQQAQRKLAPFGTRALLVQQTADRLPFPSGRFDAVVCLESLEFFPSDRAALREMVRVLQPGGILLVTRRRGWAGKAFLRRYRTVAQFEAHLTELGLIGVNTQPWQFDYDLVFGYKLLCPPTT